MAHYQVSAQTVTTIDKNVYMITHADAKDGYPISNTMVIIGKHSVMVVDPGYLPSVAAKDIGAIRKLTSKPVRYVVNSHYHNDHTNANTVYADSFPGLSIIALSQTKRLQEMNAEQFERAIEEMKETSAAYEKSKTATDKKNQSKTDSLKKVIDEDPWFDEQWNSYRYTAANLYFEKQMDIDLGGGMIVQLFDLGRGNTIGDIVTFIPSVKVVSSGDLVVRPIPYCYLGYPSEWVKTLKKLKELSPKYIMPGHGDLLTNFEYIDDLIEIISLVVYEVDQQISMDGHTSRFPKIQAGIKKVETRINWEPYRKKFAGDNKELRDFFDDSVIGGLIRAAFAELEAR